MAQWVFFVAAAVVAYLGISWFAQLSGGSSTSALSAFFSTIKPIPLLIVTAANMFFGLALFYGFGLTRFAVPATIAIGVLTSFVYSIVFLGAEVTAVKLAGVLIVIVGIIVLAL